MVGGTIRLTGAFLLVFTTLCVLALLLARTFRRWASAFVIEKKAIINVNIMVSRLIVVLKFSCKDNK
jgi:hypothetical protein